VGAEDAPKIAEFYVTHHDRWYVQKLHPLNLLLSDIQKLRTEWLAGVKMTGTLARQEEVSTHNEEALKRIMEHPNYQFKFVISNEEDVQEIFSDFVLPLSIPLKNVVCMPGLDDVANFEERTQFCLEMAKKYKFRGLTRLHIAAWNKTLNV